MCAQSSLKRRSASQLTEPQFRVKIASATVGPSRKEIVNGSNENKWYYH